MNRVIILLGQRVRSGTNFVGSMLAQHPDVVTLPLNKSFGEFNLYNDNIIIDNVFNKVARKSFGLNLSHEEKSVFLQNYGICWLNVLLSKFDVPKEKVIFLKSPNVKFLNLWQHSFPHSQISIICRDGRDNVISSVKASNSRRRWQTFDLKLKRLLNYYSGRSFINHAKEWTETAKYINDVQQNSQIKYFRYESLLDSEKSIKALLDHYQLNGDPDIIQKCLNAPVVGSSFGINSRKQSKPNWSPDYNNSSYNFTAKWKHWGFIKKRVFKFIAGQALIDLSYEKNSDW